MSIDTFNDRNIKNRPGKYYVDSQCLDCDLCRATAPGVFTRFHSEGYSYVVRQPESPEEFEQVRESLEWCPVQAIHDDGDQFDWGLEIPLQSTRAPQSKGQNGFWQRLEGYLSCQQRLALAVA